jgi:hypothetical protein
VYEMRAELYEGLDYSTERPCQIGRITYRVGIYDYVALTFRFTDDPEMRWWMTWVGGEGEDAARLPTGIFPSDAMLDALARAEARDA